MQSWETFCDCGAQFGKRARGVPLLRHWGGGEGGREGGRGGGGGGGGSNLMNMQTAAAKARMSLKSLSLSPVVRPSVSQVQDLRENPLV